MSQICPKLREVGRRVLERKTWLNVVGLAIVAPIVVTAVTWEAGKEWAWYAPIRQTISFLISVLSKEIAVPTWAIPAGLMGIAAAVWLLCRWRARKEPTPPALPPDIRVEELPSLEELKKPVGFTAEDERVLKLLYDLDGDWIDVASIAKILSTRVLRTESIIDSLVEDDFVSDRHNYLSGSEYRLADRGVRYAREKGWGSAPSA